MESQEYLIALDEYFCSRYSEYTRLSAIEGYEMPEVLYIEKDGNIARRDPSCMRLCRQREKDVLLARFKSGLEDTDFTFSFAFPSLRARIGDRFRKETFAKLLPAFLERANTSWREVSGGLNIAPRYLDGIAKGRLYPEKNTVLAIALLAGMNFADAEKLLSVREFQLEETNVRDVVCEYLLRQRITNPEMRARCLAEYKIRCLPIK